MKKSIFNNWTARCHWLHNIMTNLPDESELPNIQEKIDNLLKEKLTLKNKNGNTVKWTPTKEDELEKLKKKKELIQNDELPSGALSALEDEYLRIKYKRTKTFSSKQTDKGTRVENDSIELLSDLDDVIYFKNEERLYNSYLNGEPDIRIKREIDVKSNYDIYSFNKAELVTEYKFQIKAYLFLEQDNKSPLLETTTEGELCYCLVNSKVEQIITAKKSLYFNHGYSEEAELDDPKFIEKLKEIELNMIFDFDKFKKDYPNYDLELTPIERISIPKEKRVKRFKVTLDSEDIKHITRRVTMARDWLIERDLRSEIENIL